MKIYKQLLEVMKGCSTITKSRSNTNQHYKFRGIDDVYNSLHSVFRDNGVFTTTEILEERSEERTTKSGGVSIYRILKIKFRFFADDGSCVESTVMGEGMDTGDKASNKAMAVAHKYAILQMFLIPTEDAKDPENESLEVAPKEARQRGDFEKIIGYINTATTLDDINRLKKLLPTRIWLDKELSEINDAFGIKEKNL